MFRSIFSLLVICSCTVSIFAQQEEDDNYSELIQVVDDFFVGMHDADTALIRSLLHPSARMLTTGNQNGKPIHQFIKMDDFMVAVVQPRTKEWEEKLWSYNVTRDDHLATVWTDYTFLLEGSISHCGVNIFSLLETSDGWKITEISDTRRTTDCRSEGVAQNDEVKIHQLLDDWHLAAATADEDAFFGTMTVDGIYLGTDATERWYRDELKSWAADAFERESAWSFTARDRQIYFSDDYETAWFEELLDTWMGECRGSGVLSKENGEWKLRHYDLAIMVPNDLVQAYIKLAENPPQPEPEKKKKKRKKKKD